MGFNLSDIPEDDDEQLALQRPRIARPNEGAAIPPLTLRGVSPAARQPGDVFGQGSQTPAEISRAIPSIARPMAVSNRGIPVNVQTPSGRIPSSPVTGEPEPLNN